MRCGDRCTIGHQCKKQLLLLDKEEEEKEEELEMIEEGDEEGKGAISLHANG